MTWHVVMPLSRPEVVDVYVRWLASQRVTWHPIVERPLANLFPDEPWIKPLVVTVPPGKNPCYWKLNEAARVLKPSGHDDWWSFVTDDNLWEHDYWVKLQERACSTPGCKWVMSAQRRPHGVLAGECCLRAFACDLSQLTLRGDVWARERFDEALWFADGMMVEWLVARHGKPLFVNDVMVYYNALRPADWGYPASEAADAGGPPIPLR